MDEEALVSVRSEGTRRREGAYYTPRPLVECVLDAVAPLVPDGLLRVIDPACGAGAFLSCISERYPKAELIGADLSAEAVAQCQARTPHARLAVGDTLNGALAPLLPSAADDRFELWIGNPPYNGTSALLRNPDLYRRVRALLPSHADLPRGTSLRDDFAFFLLHARERLGRVNGALAFLTPASWLDSYLYAPLRRSMLETLQLSFVIELGAGVFQGTRIRTCLTVWRSRRADAPALYRARAIRAGPFHPRQLGAAQPFTPAAPDWLLRPIPAAAESLDAAWRQEGEPITTLLPISFPGLKTRFDELLVDEDPLQLLRRLEAFVAASPSHLAPLAQAHGIPAAHLDKLAALKAALPPGYTVLPERVRPFYRYQGARHRGTLPASARAYCYLDRALIPRGDHRLRGALDPHAEPVKLIFNLRELPLSAALLGEAGCVHDHRHARFAPLHVPERIWREGLKAARGPAGSELGPPVLNLSLAGRRWAERMGGPVALLARLVAFVNSCEVQEQWAPTFGAIRTLPINERCLSNASGWEVIARTALSHYEERFALGGTG